MVEKRGKFTLRKINMKDFPAEVERARAVYNEFETGQRHLHAVDQGGVRGRSART